MNGLFRSMKCLCAMLLLSGSPALAKPWDEVIVDVSLLSDRLFDAARSRGVENVDSKALLFLDEDRHYCAILGRMLERIDDVRHLEEMEITEPADEMSEEKLDQMLVDAFSLQTWALVAERLLDYSQSERIRAWNLKCVGFQNIPSDAGFYNETAPTGLQTLLSQRADGYSGALTGAVAATWTGRLVEVGQGLDRRIVTIIQDGYHGSGIWRLVTDCTTGAVDIVGPPLNSNDDTGSRLPEQAIQRAQQIYCENRNAPPKELLNIPLEGVYADWWNGIPETVGEDVVIEINGVGYPNFGSEYDTRTKGLLILDCETNKHSWAGVAGRISGQAIGFNVNISEYIADPEVPSDLLRNAKRLYCELMS